MLGCYHDAEEAVQETLLRAWQGLAGYEGRAPLRHWLYRITTTTCLKVINRRARDPITTTLDVAWLQPYPDALLDQLTDADADPAVKSYS
jgi:RNA polymerase sigma-70 factor, ECF subfamily